MRDKIESWRKDAHLPHIATAHDVRHLRQCCGCRDLGDRRRMLLVKVGQDGACNGVGLDYMHGRCFIKSRGLPAFLALDAEETSKVSLGDIGTEAMKALMERQ